MHFKYNRLNQIHQATRSGGFLLLLFFSITGTVVAQGKKDTVDMARDERGKYIHYEVVEQKNVGVDLLKERALSFLALKKFKAVKAADTQVNAAGKFIINKTALMLSHPSGELSYNLTFEAKAGRYRFWLADFLFIPYKRDRYGNFVAATSKGRPLENSPGKLNAGEWTSYIDAAEKQSAALAAEFKNHLAVVQKVKAPTAKKKVISKSW
jgi:hypothetical protein